MRRSLFLCGLALLAPALLPAQQTTRWNTTPNGNWSGDAPSVRVVIEGQRSPTYGAPMRVRFEVSEDAYVAIVRVDGNGQMNILFPYSRTQRAAVRGGQVNYVRSSRLGDVAFYSTGRNGYVFAIASYTPLDFSSFENRDYDRLGAFSQFTQVNRSVANRPDVFIDRFAARVLWDVDTPYDYDVDYYFPAGNSAYTTQNALAMCGSMFNQFTGSMYGTMPIWAWSDWDLAPYPYRSMCRQWSEGVRCFSYLGLATYAACNMGVIAVNNPTTQQPVPGTPSDSVKPNEGVIRGGMFGPSPVPLIPADAPPAERPVGRFDQVKTGPADDLDRITSIPTRATKKMKEDDARRERVAETTARTFDRVESTKMEKPTTADASNRVQPPPREPTKSKGNSEPRAEPTRKSGFGSSSNTGRTSEPRSTGTDRDRTHTVAQPPSGGVVGTPNPPSIQGTTTEKKKPPTD